MINQIDCSVYWQNVTAKKYLLTEVEYVKMKPKNMVKQAQSDAAEFIHSLNMNGLHGRMLVAPASNKRAKEILLLYGHHAQLERWWGLVQNLQTYGPVTLCRICLALAVWILFYPLVKTNH